MHTDLQELLQATMEIANSCRQKKLGAGLHLAFQLSYVWSFVCSFALFVSLDQILVPTHSLWDKGQMDKGTKGQWYKGTKGQRDKRTKRQTDKGTNGQTDKQTNGQTDKRTKGQRTLGTCELVN